MKTDVFIVSHPRHYDWLRLCLQSLRVFFVGHRAVHLVIPNDAHVPQFAIDCLIHRESEQVRHGYARQQVEKMRAYRRTDADRIFYIDSDYILASPTSLAFYLDHTKSILHVLSFDEVRALGGFARKQPAFDWQPRVEAALGMKCECFTGGLPHVHSRDVLERCCQRIEQVHGMSLEDYANTLDRRAFYEQLVIGAYALEFERHHYEVRAWSRREDRFAFNWSFDPVTDEVLAKWEPVLYKSARNRSAPSAS